MVFAAWVLLLLLLTLLFSHWLKQQNNPNQNLEVRADPDGQDVIVLQRNRSGHYLASGFVNRVPVTFLLDTGATYVAVSEDLADEAGLRKGIASTSMTANGPVRSWQTTVDELRLGPINMHKVPASILPSLSGDEVLLGMSFLKHLELRQTNDRLMIRVPAR